MKSLYQLHQDLRLYLYVVCVAQLDVNHIDVQVHTNAGAIERSEIVYDWISNQNKRPKRMHNV